MKRRWIAIPLAALLLGGSLCAGLTWRWSHTPYGELDPRAALSLYLLSFELEMQPDPESPFTMAIPVNLVYALSGLLPQAEVAATEDRVASWQGQEVPVRVYWPQEPASEPPPVLVYFHGGGFVVGSVDIFDGLTRSLAQETGAIVVSVEYRLAPVHPFPAAVDDAWVALQWTMESAAELGGDPSFVFVGGDSAGGNLATVTAMRARDAGGPALAGQLLYYPVTDFTGASWPSAERFSEDYGLSSRTMQGFNQAYIPEGTDLQDPWLSPLRAPSHAGLPPALVVTAGFDPLRDSGAAYAEAMEQAGVEVQYQDFPSMVHGFMSVDLYRQRAEGLAVTGEFVDGLRTQRGGR